jgi:hypothetical protein
VHEDSKSTTSENDDKKEEEKPENKEEIPEMDDPTVVAELANSIADRKPFHIKHLNIHFQ